MKWIFKTASRNRNRWE